MGSWVANFRELILSSDFDMRRELVCRAVKSVVARPDKAAKMTWDLPAVMNLIDGKEVPVTTLPLEGFENKALRGRAIQISNRPNSTKGPPLPVIPLNFEVIGKNRWPYGWPILEELSFPLIAPIP